MVNYLLVFCDDFGFMKIMPIPQMNYIARSFLFFWEHPSFSKGGSNVRIEIGPPLVYVTPLLDPAILIQVRGVHLEGVQLIAFCIGLALKKWPPFDK